MANSIFHIDHILYTYSIHLLPYQISLPIIDCYLIQTINTYHNINCICHIMEIHTQYYCHAMPFNIGSPWNTSDLCPILPCRLTEGPKEEHNTRFSPSGVIDFQMGQTSQRGNKEPMSHEILMFVCLQKDAK